ncbi:ATP-binding protein [Pedobacter sp. Du54]|uniref:AlbA family DNA-binding domain-containing protein n=1 Tax=Pedobacter anseongensis TaxID=3133439 RepID=UPI003099985F
MDLTSELTSLIGRPENETLEYKAVLPPSRVVAKIICAFANTEGGFLVLGVTDDLQVNGLSDDLHANEITHKAIDLLSPHPVVTYQYFTYHGKRLYVIKVAKSADKMLLQGVGYMRVGVNIIQIDPPAHRFNSSGYGRLSTLSQSLELGKANATGAKIKFAEHYQRILKIFDDMGLFLYPAGTDQVTDHPEGLVLARILFSSFVDNFETYMSDLLYEIYLSNSNLLKSKQTVTVEEVLNCADMQEFVKYCSRQKVLKLGKGSVKGFVNDNKEISQLGIVKQNEVSEIERILQIRHLYAHRNGVIDDKFLLYYPGLYNINENHSMSIAESCDKLEYLTNIVDKLDKAAVMNYHLAAN